MSDGWNTGWLNTNANRAFPFKEDTSRTNDIGVTVPNSMLVDLIFTVPGTAAVRYYVKTIMLSSTHLTIVFADEDDVTVSSVVIDASVHSENDAYTLNGVGTFEDGKGRIAVGRLDDLYRMLPEGIHEFSLAQTELEARTVRPDIRGVRGVNVVNRDGEVSDRISGIVRLLAGQNIRLVYIPPTIEDLPDPITGVDVPTITTPAGVRIDAIDGIDFNEECECEATLPLSEPIRTINGVTPDSGGNITIESPEGCFEINAENGKLTFNDTCSKPCCGCTELEFITDRLKLADSTASILQSRLDELDTRELEFFQNVLETIK